MSYIDIGKVYQLIMTAISNILHILAKCRNVSTANKEQNFRTEEETWFTKHLPKVAYISDLFNGGKQILEK